MLERKHLGQQLGSPAILGHRSSSDVATDADEQCMDSSFVLRAPFAGRAFGALLELRFLRSALHLSFRNASRIMGRTGKYEMKPPMTHKSLRAARKGSGLQRYQFEVLARG